MMEVVRRTELIKTIHHLAIPCYEIPKNLLLYLEIVIDEIYLTI